MVWSYLPKEPTTLIYGGGHRPLITIKTCSANVAGTFIIRAFSITLFEAHSNLKVYLILNKKFRSY